MTFAVILFVSAIVFFLIALSVRRDYSGQFGINFILGAICLVLGFGIYHNTHKENETSAEIQKGDGLEPGYYKVLILREEKALNFQEEDSLTAVVEDSSGKIQVINIPKEKPIGWDPDSKILKVYMKNDTKLYWFMDSIE